MRWTQAHVACRHDNKVLLAEDLSTSEGVTSTLCSCTAFSVPAHLGEDIYVFFIPAAMDLDDSMHDRNVPPFDVEHDYLPSADWGVAHLKKQDVSTIEAWLHAATQHNYNLRTRFGQILSSMC